MDKFLERLHKKPEHHKRQFAFLASCTITLLIFGIWSLATFGVRGETIAEKDDASLATESTQTEVSPFESFRTNLSTSLEALRSSFGEMQKSFESKDLPTEYKKMRDGALDIYGQ